MTKKKFALRLPYGCTFAAKKRFAKNVMPFAKPPRGWEFMSLYVTSHPPFILGVMPGFEKRQIMRSRWKES